MRDSLVAVAGAAGRLGIPTDVCWMDDLCLMGSTESADALFPALSLPAGVRVDVCIEHGMSPNLQKAKSEALTVVCGPGSVRVRREVFGSSEPDVEIQSRHWPASRLRVVPRYRHLGGILTMLGPAMRNPVSDCSGMGEFRLI